MDSPQSVVSPFKTSIVAELEKQSFDNSGRTAANVSKGIDHHETKKGNPESYMGSLEVYVHQARDIHNICIYHKQDVYAKLCLTSDPEQSVSTKIINGGGRNPVFNDNVQLNVNTVESSLKCEIFMMSRVRNYLEDQLLGFALVPLSEVLIKNGKLEKEFSLSSTDLFHSPAGFVQLSLSYTGASPEVMAIPGLSSCTDGCETQESLSCEFEKMEFPDPKIVNENNMMVSEYFGISREDSETSDVGNHAESDGVHFVESFSADSGDIHKHDSPPSSVSTNGVSSPSSGAISHTSESPVAITTSPPEELGPVQKDKGLVDVGDGQSDSTESEKIVKPVITVNLEPEQKMVQQDIVDMYMKSMQQFTESLAKMKLPLDMDNGPTSSGSSTTSDQKTQQASKNNGSRVFYGSRAFF